MVNCPFKYKRNGIVVWATRVKGTSLWRCDWPRTCCSRLRMTATAWCRMSSLVWGLSLFRCSCTMRPSSLKASLMSRTRRRSRALLAMRRSFSRSSFCSGVRSSSSLLLWAEAGVQSSLTHQTFITLDHQTSQVQIYTSSGTEDNTWLCRCIYIINELLGIICHSLLYLAILTYIYEL